MGGSKTRRPPPPRPVILYIEENGGYVLFEYADGVENDVEMMQMQCQDMFRGCSRGRALVLELV